MLITNEHNIYVVCSLLFFIWCFVSKIVPCYLYSLFENIYFLYFINDAH